MLCYHGYFFHVTTNGAVQIKEDNELFRFQAPYFWISTNWTTGNIEYGRQEEESDRHFARTRRSFAAIYLIKRTLRNRQRHGLEEHETVRSERMKCRSMTNRSFAFQRALEDLKKKLLHQWDFVTMQAEAQFR